MVHCLKDLLFEKVTRTRYIQLNSTYLLKKQGDANIIKRIQVFEIHENIPDSLYETSTALISKSKKDTLSKQTIIKICK